MYDFKPTLVSNLKTIGLPVYDEFDLALDMNNIPCITYSEQNDLSDKEGGNLRYFKKTYLIKYWCDGSSSEAAANISSIDELMFSLGFKRTAYNEMNYSPYMSMNIRYQGLGLETV